MSTVYDRRLAALEASELPQRRITRIVHLVVNPDRDLEAIQAQDIKRGVRRMFVRRDGESDEALKARARAEMGWADEQL